MKTRGFNTLNNDETAPEWDRIKSWLGAADTVDKHPVQEHLEREQRKNPKKMDEGGIAGDDTLKVGPVPPGGPEMGAPVNPAQLPPPPQAPPMPPQAPNPVAAAPVTPQQPTADSILGTNPQELKDFLMKVNRPTTGQAIGSGVAGLGDAIMQGVSRAGPSHFQENADKRIQQNRENLSAIPGKVAELGKEKFGLTQTLDAQNPNSSYSKINQQTYGPDLIKMGLSKDQVSKMPASLISDLLGKKITLEEALARIQETGTYQQGMLANTAANQKAQIQQGAAKGLESRGVLEKLRDFVSPSPETQTLERQATGGSSSTPNIDHGAALQWAQQNPKDPRAAIILQRAKEGLSGQ